MRIVSFAPSIQHTYMLVHRFLTWNPLRMYVNTWTTSVHTTPRWWRWKSWWVCTCVCLVMLKPLLFCDTDRTFYLRNITDQCNCVLFFVVVAFSLRSLNVCNYVVYFMSHSFFAAYFFFLFSLCTHPYSFPTIIFGLASEVSYHFRINYRSVYHLLSVCYHVVSITFISNIWRKKF